MSEYTLHLGDCRDVLAGLQPGSVDVVIADPPYGETSLAWDVPVPETLTLLLPLLKPHGSLWCFGSMRFFLTRAGDFGAWTMSQDVIWEKHNGSSFASDRFRRIHEHALHFYPSGVPWGEIYKKTIYVAEPMKTNHTRKTSPPHTGKIRTDFFSASQEGKRLMQSIIATPNCHGYAIHPTQKPTAIIAPLLEYSCPPGGTVLDPFAGSASVGIAALQRGLTYIGIERDETYHEAATRRLEAYAAQGSLFEAVS